MQDPLLKPDELTCHRTGHKKLCKSLRDKCPLWMKMTRKDPRTDAVIDEWLCGDVWNTILAAELVREMRGVHAATNSFRNETVKRSDSVLHLAAEVALLNQVQALPAPDDPKVIDMEIISDEQNNDSS